MTEEYGDFGSVADLFRGLKTAKGEEARRKPFKFLDPYGPEDKDIFFGRGLEIAEIFARFYKSRLLVVYGESGSGKTSLIQCGLRSEIPPQDMQFYTIRSAIDPLEALRKEIIKHTGFAEGEAPSACIDLLREAVLRKSKPVAIVFDQFEEFFIFQPESVRERFIRELASWLDQDVNVQVIVCIRGEYLDRLTELEVSLPQLYQNRLWIRRMSREQAKDVITGPCRACGVEIETDLTDELLEVLTRGGRGVELPILQVVLDTLYNKAVETLPESPKLTLSSYLELGKIDSILARFIEDKVNAHENPDQARQVLKAMVTPEGTRRISSGREISENAAQFGEPIPEEALVPILNSLIDDRIIREDEDNHFFELRHDTLAQTIRQWMTGIEQELMEVRQTLENRYKEYQVRSTLLDVTTLEYIAPYESRLTLKSELAEFIDKSRKEAAKRRRRWLTLLGSAIGLFVVVVSALGIFSYLKAVEATQKAIEANEKFVEAEHNLGLVFNEKAKKALDDHNFNAARLYALYVLKKSGSTSPEYALARSILLSSPDYGIIFSSPNDSHHNSAVRVVAFSPDGRTLASGSDDYTIRLWDVEMGKEKATLTEHTDPVQSVSFSPDGRTLASGSLGGTIRLWDVETGKEKATLEGHTHSVNSVSFSPDGRTLASGSGDKTIRLWDVVTGKEKATLTGHTASVQSVSFSPDGRTLASGSDDKTIRLWDVETGKEKATLEGHTSLVYSISFSPDGRTLASGSLDDTIRLWDVETGKEKATLTGHTGPVYSVSFSPDGRTLASGSGDKTIRLWDVVTEKEKATLAGNWGQVLSVSFSPDGRTLASGLLDDTIRLWDVETEKEKATLTGHTDSVLSVSFSPDGRTLTSGSVDAIIDLWDVLTGKEKAELEGHTASVLSVSFSPDGRTLASGSGDDTIRLWDVETEKEKATLTGHTDVVLSVSFSPDGRTLASGSDDKTIRLWDVGTGKEKATLEGHTGPVLSVSFSPDGRTLASGSDDKTIRLWDVETGKEKATLTGHTGSVQSVSFSPDGRTLASGLDDDTIRLWDVETEKEKATLTGHTDVVLSVSFSPDGRTLASGSDDNTIRLWDVETGKEKATLTGHTGFWVHSVSFSPDGRTLASGSGDHTIRLWDVSGLHDTRSIEERIKEAEREYNLALSGIELKPIDPAMNLYGSAEVNSPEWPKHHPLHWLRAAESGDAEAMVKLGIIYDRDNEIDKALYWYQKAADAGNAHGKERLEFLLRWTSIELPRLLLSQAQDFLDKNQWQEVISRCDWVIKYINPKHADPLLLRARAYLGLNQLDKAIADYREAIGLDPESADAYGELGWALIKQGHFVEAREPALKAHSLDKDNFVWTATLGHTYILQGDPKTAGGYYEEALVQIPDETAFKEGPVADFEFFIQKGWQVKECKKTLVWMRDAFARRQRNRQETPAR